ncbi:(2Fe-2S) ferredoxin domain-containing protein [bacterium]|nr:(2Fe-2S) ferredoxin domain-containing protein [bacterium]
MKHSDTQSHPTEPPTVLVCQHQSCLRHGSAETLKAFQAAAKNASFKVECSGCMGQCSTGPTVRVTPDEVWYYRVQPEDVPAIAEQHLEGGNPVEEKLNPRIHPQFSYH